ncbi:MAG: hypothetical protein ACD_5C00162G0002 [uncultured bacterium]|nr:MAG: hypothetical protein ACD_5C00162G0002 [uncultured bacterium]KKQ60862.1 MAG: UDP-N-acetylmuramoylalanyl-D-glutamyl-2,6-diaminopimelate-D-alanyl-D-alanyl ligase, UDP-N-acetylmuramoylalanyl-D-glutamyl-2,6-diaminopimelate-D-alanyl-D-alanine ligase [Parcubacteria group bacterium GW2011_GWC1_38_22]
MAEAVLARHKPKIIGITGSVGKTSTKAAVFAVLSSKFNVRENQKNYNNEIGIPLTIIGAGSGGRNIFKWIWIFIKWLFALINPKYPEILILELGVDRPDDMKYFMSFIRPMMGIVTNISSSHIEYFKTVDNIAKEKRILIESLASDGFAILNGDDEKAVTMSQNTKAQVVTFGQVGNPVIGASGIIYNYEKDIPIGISFKLNYDGKNIPIRLRNILAAHQVYAALAAVSAGIIFKMNLVEIASALELLRSPAGRMNLLEGSKDSFVIDDTYNASPVSTIAALDVLGELKAKRKIAVLGDMLELGNQSEHGHRDVARKIFSTKVDMFIAVGSRMKRAVEELVSLGFPGSNVMHFDDPEQASEKIAKMIVSGDFILVKGSQGMRMEKIVEKLLKNTSDAENLLCRQSREWRRKPFKKP